MPPEAETSQASLTTSDFHFSGTGGTWLGFVRASTAEMGGSWGKDVFGLNGMYRTGRIVLSLRFHKVSS